MDAPATKRLTGRTVLICLLGFFGIVIGVNVVMMTLAIETLPGTEVDSAYKASLAFNHEISAARQQVTRGWRITAHVERAPDGHADVLVEARDRAGAPLTNIIFSARLERPTDQRADRLVRLREKEVGIYRGEAENVAVGLWDIVLEGERGKERVFLSRNRIVLQ